MIGALTKDEINALPLYRYDGPVHVVRAPEAVEAAVLHLRREAVLGFDTETRPAFKRGESYSPALIQLAGADGVWLFQLHQTGFTDPLRDLLADPDTLKVGVALGADVAGLQGLADFEPGGCVDLAPITTRLGFTANGLRGLAAVVLGLRVSKGAQRSNWSRPTLSPAQIAYAAGDAWIAWAIYCRLEADGLLEPAPSNSR